MSCNISMTSRAAWRLESSCAVCGCCWYCCCCVMRCIAVLADTLLSANGHDLTI